MSEDEKTVETFTEKITRMFMPIRTRKKGRSLDKTDIQTVDPLERFEKAILRDSESKNLPSDKAGEQN